MLQVVGSKCQFTVNTVRVISSSSSILSLDQIISMDDPSLLYPVFSESDPRLIDTIFNVSSLTSGIFNNSIFQYAGLVIVGIILFGKIFYSILLTLMNLFQDLVLFFLYCEWGVTFTFRYIDIVRYLSGLITS